MKKEKIALWIIIGILLLIVIYTVFFQDSSSTSFLGQNARQAASAYSGMVGGC